jgi:hypothetical protein
VLCVCLTGDAIKKSSIAIKKESLYIEAKINPQQSHHRLSLVPPLLHSNECITSLVGPRPATSCPTLGSSSQTKQTDHVGGYCDKSRTHHHNLVSLSHTVHHAHLLWDIVTQNRGEQWTKSNQALGTRGQGGIRASSSSNAPKVERKQQRASRQG